MSGFSNVRAYVDAINGGRSSSCSLRKVPSQATTASWWADLSMAAGNPKPNYYASDPLAAATLDGLDGILHGDDKSPEQKHLTDWMLVSPTAGFVGRFMLLDYLLYYPFVDGDELDTQTMDNTITLPRYADGAGVQAMMVAAAPTTGSGRFTFDYINQDGNAATSPTQFCSVAAANIASLITSEPASAANGSPFLRLANGDSGIRQITSVSGSVANGGLAAIVLVQPIANHVIREVNTPSEVNFVTQVPGAPRIYDGAYLNMIVQCSATIAAGTLAGRLNFAWG